MEKSKKYFMIQMGRRLKHIRENCGCTQEVFAETLGISVEHYRKLENGVYCLQPEKILILYQRYRADPTYLITGDRRESFDPELFLTNCNHQERKLFLERFWSYVRKRI